MPGSLRKGMQEREAFETDLRRVRAQRDAPGKLTLQTRLSKDQSRSDGVSKQRFRNALEERVYPLEAGSQLDQRGVILQNHLPQRPRRDQPRYVTAAQCLHKDDAGAARPELKPENADVRSTEPVRDV